MNLKLEQEILHMAPEGWFEGYRKLSKSSPLKFGLDHGDGWFKIWVELIDRLKDLNLEEFKFIQIKEKFGKLRVYYDSLDKDTNKINKIIAWAERKSAKTCEVCGNPGKLEDDGWLRTICKECRDKKLKKEE